MSEVEPASRRVHYAGLALALLSAAVLVFSWIVVLPLLDGTIVEELKYLVYAVFAAGVLSGAHWMEGMLTSRE